MAIAKIPLLSFIRVRTTFAYKVKSKNIDVFLMRIRILNRSVLVLLFVAGCIAA